MLKILIIQQIYSHSDTEMEIMLHGNLSTVNLYQECFHELKHQLAEKGFESKYGKIDPKHEFVTKFVCTPANVHDSQVINKLLSSDDTAIFTDKPYDSKARKKWYRERGVYYCDIG